jgi:hypothetical protein
MLFGLKNFDFAIYFHGEELGLRLQNVKKKSDSRNICPRSAASFSK